MTQEEKAKAYDEAIEKAGERYNEEYASTLERSTLAYVFPELKESEDERIRKELIRAFKSLNTIKVWNGIERTDILAWLEKQGANFVSVTKGNNSITNAEVVSYPTTSTTIKPKFMVGDSIKTTNEEPLTITKITDSGYWSEDLFICSFENSAKWELVGRLANKVEPKFKTGEWVVLSTSDGEKVVQIDSIEYFKSGEPRYITSEGKWFGNGTKAHLWTIQDAKDGDVLTWNNTTCVVLFKNIKDIRCFISYCFANFISFEVGTSHYIRGCHPATKEQRNILFAKMKEAGYEWDSENKELRKIEQKSKEKTKFYDSMDDLIADALIEEIENSELDGRSKHNRIFWIKSHRQKPAWSEEDEKRIKNILSVLDVQVCWDGATGKKENPYQKEIDWLKSLSPQNKWKPSDEQMEVLLSEVNAWFKGCPKQIVLESLYTDLKKL